MSVLWIMIPGFFVGWAIMESVRSIFSEDRRLVRRLLADQPVTMGSGATAIGSIVVWAVLRALGVM